jgi:hypothetical protein
MISQVRDTAIPQSDSRIDGKHVQFPRYRLSCDTPDATALLKRGSAGLAGISGGTMTDCGIGYPATEQRQRLSTANAL